jgi:hypothetical protein
VTEGAPRRVHFLICTNERGARRAASLLRRARRARSAWRLSGRVCAPGLAARRQGQRRDLFDDLPARPDRGRVPEGIWYGGVSEVDVCELFDAHLCERGEPAVVTRLRVPSTTRIW